MYAGSPGAATNTKIVDVSGRHVLLKVWADESELISMHVEVVERG
jgi:hypothetical protein